MIKVRITIKEEFRPPTQESLFNPLLKCGASDVTVMLAVRKGVFTCEIPDHKFNDVQNITSILTVEIMNE